MLQMHNKTELHRNQTVSILYLTQHNESTYRLKRSNMQANSNLTTTTTKAKHWAADRLTKASPMLILLFPDTKTDINDGIKQIKPFNFHSDRW